MLGVGNQSFVLNSTIAVEVFFEGVTCHNKKDEQEQLTIQVFLLVDLLNFENSVVQVLILKVFTCGTASQ